MSTPAAPIAILGAMPEEIAALLEALEEREPQRLHGLESYRGKLDGHHVLLAQSGIGKVNAAAVAQTLVTQSPTSLIFLGVAGAADARLRTGDLVVSTDAVQHDVDVTALGYEVGRVPGEPLSWSAAPELVRLAVESARSLVAEPGGEWSDVRVVTGRVASGDQFLADPDRTRAVRDRFGAVCVEMEGAAVAQVCARSGVPFVIIRSISDSADGNAELSFREFTDLAASRAKGLVRRMLQRL